MFRIIVYDVNALWTTLSFWWFQNNSSSYGNGPLEWMMKNMIYIIVKQPWSCPSSISLGKVRRTNEEYPFSKLGFGYETIEVL